MSLGAPIEFITEYEAYGETWYDVMYSSNNLRTYISKKVPNTIRMFIEQAPKRRERYDYTFKRHETIYSV